MPEDPAAELRRALLGSVRTGETITAYLHEWLACDAAFHDLLEAADGHRRELADLAAAVERPEGETLERACSRACRHVAAFERLIWDAARREAANAREFADCVALAEEHVATDGAALRLVRLAGRMSAGAAS